MTRYTTYVPAVGGAETCGGLDTRGIIMMVHGHPTEAATAVAIYWISSAK